MREIPLNLSLDQTWKISNGETLTTHEIFTKLKKREIKKMLFCENEIYEEDTIKQRFNIVGDYGILQNLGEGNFGSVYRCYNINHGSENYAIKIPNSSLIKSYEDQGLSLGQLFSEEAVAVARLSVCENVVAVVDHDTEYPYLVLEYCSEGTLTSKLQKDYCKEDIYNWAMQISTALKVAHSLRPKNLIHRDLKPDNILIANGILKIADFGGAKMRGETSKSMVTARGGYTPLYASPEAFDGKFNTGVDIWSLGVILYQAVTDTFPFVARDINELIDSVKNKPIIRLQNFDSVKVKVDKTFIELIESCLEKNWHNRPSAEEIYQFFAAKINNRGNAISNTPKNKDFVEKISIQPQIIKQENVRDVKVERRSASDANIVSIPGFGFLREKAYSCNGQTHTVEEYLHDETGMEFVKIPGGSFTMGGGTSDDEKPAHRVTLDSFLLCKTEVTQGVWQKIMGSAPWKDKSYVKEGSNHAATYVSWNDAKEFCDRVGLQLPTEAQWEYACRSGSSDKYYWGNNMDGDYAWYYDNADKVGNEYAHQVAQKKPNAFGLYDMSGNVWEWCHDWYDQNYYSSSPTANPKGPDRGSGRVFRGGSWNSLSDPCRSRPRVNHGPGYRFYSVGFRPSVHYP